MYKNKVSFKKKLYTKIQDKNKTNLMLLLRGGLFINSDNIFAV